MDTEQLAGEELIQMMQKGKGNICISIIVPTHRLLHERKIDPLDVEVAVIRAKEHLQHNYPSQEIKPLIQKLNRLYKDIDFDHNMDGIGLFVSGSVKQLIHFPFPVKEKVIIGDSFEVRDLLYLSYYSLPYFVLFVSHKEMRLFRGSGHTLHELRDSNFPKKYEEEYEYNEPSRGSSYSGSAFVKEVEKEKSQLEEIRFDNYLAQADDKLDSYLTAQTPLVVAGAKKDLSSFKRITEHTKNIAGQVMGNYAYTPERELGKLTQEVIIGYCDHSKRELVKEFEEKIGKGHGITGIREIWKAAKEGRALKLLVEKDFAMPGFLKPDNSSALYLHSPGEPRTAIADVIDDLIETVLEKKGDVIILENNSLVNHQRVALITRY